MPIGNLRSLGIADLLTTHSAVLEELRLRNVLRSKNNPTGDYAEWLVSQKLALTLEKNSSKGYDARDAKGRKYQIKGRRVTSANKSTLLGVIRNLKGGDFDFLIAVIFDQDWKVRYAARIAHSDVLDLVTYRPHVNGHAMCLRPTVFENRRVTDISHLPRT